MKKELNIAAILKDKPNIRIYDLLHNIYVKLNNISTTDGETVIWCTKEYPDKTTYFGYSELGTERGWLDGLQILKPSKEMRSWEKFAWKKGDVLRCGVDNLCIFESWANNNYTEFNAMYVTHSYANSTCPTKMWTKETNEEIIKQYISKIEEIKGGKLNLRTFTIEKQPEFKDGDIVTAKFYDDGDEMICVFKEKDEEFYMGHCGVFSTGKFKGNVVLNFGEDCISEEKDCNLRLATDSEKQQFFDVLANEGKVWNSETKQIEDLPKKCEFKAFDEVLVRDTDAGVWIPTLFGFYDEEFANYVCLNETFQKCIPYNDSTKHLLGTTDEWKGGEG